MEQQEVLLLFYFFSQLSLRLTSKGKPSDDKICSVLIIKFVFAHNKKGRLYNNRPLNKIKV